MNGCDRYENVQMDSCMPHMDKIRNLLIPCYVKWTPFSVLKLSSSPLYVMLLILITGSSSRRS